MKTVSLSLAVGVFLVISNIVCAQKYTQGTIEFGVLSIEGEHQFDSMFYNIFQKSVSSTIHFRPGKYVTQKKTDELDSRQVLDLVNQESYSFIDSPDSKVFERKPMSEVLDLDLNSDHKLIRVGKADSLFGFSVDEYMVINNSDTSLIHTTKDIDAHVGGLFGSQTEEVGVTLKSKLEVEGLTLWVGVSSFSPDIDSSIFSIDTTGYINKDLMKFDILKYIKDEEIANEIAENKVIKPINKPFDGELLDCLVSVGFLDSNKYDVKEALEGEFLYDTPTIISFGERRSMMSTKQTYNKNNLRVAFANCGLDYHSLDTLLSPNNGYWAKIPIENKYHAVNLAVANDYLDKKETREQIGKNIVIMDVGVSQDNEILKSYMEGDSSIEDLLAETYFFTKLKKDIISTDLELSNSTRELFELAFDGYDVEFNVSLDENGIIVNTKQSNFTVDISSLKSVDYDKTNFSEIDVSYVYKDSVSIDQNFYLNFIDIIRQISADHSLELAFGINRLVPICVSSLSDDKYDILTDSLDFLDRSYDQIYLQRYPKDEFFTKGDRLGASFDYQRYSNYQELIVTFFVGGNSMPGVDFITSDQKSQFFEYLTKHKDEFEISEEFIRDERKRINETLMFDASLLLSVIPEIELDFPIRFYGGNLNDELDARYNGDTLTFEEAYPEVSKILGKAFKATAFSHNKEKRRIHFKYNGKFHTIKIGRSDLVTFIKQNMVVKSSEKKIYELYTSNTYGDVFFYIEPRHINALSEFLKFDFRK